jgi:aspartate aminotransferase
MPVSNKIKEMMGRSSWIRRMFEEGNRLKALYGEEKVCDFSLGNPVLDPPMDFTSTLLSIVKEKIPQKHGYMPNAGYPEVRNAIASYLSREQKIDVKGDHVVITCGAGGGLNVVLKTLINPGDRVIVSVPYFVEYATYVDNHGGKLETIPCNENFDPDTEALSKAITDKTAAVIINSPNNPSGHIYSQEVLREMSRVLEQKSRENGRTIYLISDEPYRKIVFDGKTIPSVFQSYRDSIIVSSYSKDLSIPGERIGWAAVNPLAKDAGEIADGMILSNRILGFVNAPALMQRVIQHLQGRSIDVSLYQRKRDMLCKGLEMLGYEFQKPEGAFYLFPRAPGGDDLKFVEALQKELILTVPGRGFGLPGYFRIAFCVDDGVIERSMDGFARAIRAFRGGISFKK